MKWNQKTVDEMGIRVKTKLNKKLDKMEQKTVDKMEQKTVDKMEQKTEDKWE